MRSQAEPGNEGPTAPRRSSIGIGLQPFIHVRLEKPRELVEVGVGFHEDPQVPNYGKPKRGARLQPGLTIAIEPMVNVGMPGTRTMPDRWTVVTVDGTRSAHFEHTIAITENGPRILTALAT